MKKYLLICYCFFLAMTTFSQEQSPNQIDLENIDFTELAKSELIKDSLFVEQYKRHVFLNKFDRTRKIIQWKVPVLVYLDKKIPKQIRKELTSFINQIIDINNFEVKIVNNKKNANYYIRVVNEKVTGYSESFIEKYEDQMENLIFSDFTYSIFTDRRRSFYGANLTIGKDMFDKKFAIQKLKSGFFMSLGQFTNSSIANKESILNKGNFNNDQVSNYDLNLLRLHYTTNYDIEVNQITFNKILRSIKTSNEK